MGMFFILTEDFSVRKEEKPATLRRLGYEL
jgi:hypothetical protein